MFWLMLILDEDQEQSGQIASYVLDQSLHLRIVDQYNGVHISVIILKMQE